MGAGWALWIFVALILSGYRSGLEKALWKRAGLALRPQESPRKSKESSALGSSAPEPEESASSYAFADHTPRVSSSQVSFASLSQYVVVPLLSSEDEHDAAKVQHVLWTLEAGAVDTTETLQVEECQEAGRPESQRPPEPLRLCRQGRGAATSRRTMGGLVSVIENSTSKTRHGEARQGITAEATGRRRISESSEGCARPQWNSKGDKRCSSESDQCEHRDTSESCSPHTSLQSRQSEEKPGEAPSEDQRLRLRMGNIHRENEREVRSSKEGVHGNQGPALQSGGRTQGSAEPSHGRASEEGHDTAAAHHRSREEPGWEARRISMGCGSRDASYAGDRRHNETQQPSEQESEVGEVSSIFHGAPPLKAALENVHNLSESQAHSFAPFLTAAWRGTRGRLLLRFSQILMIQGEWQAHSMTVQFLRGLWDDLGRGIFRLLMLSLPLMIVGYGMLALSFSCWEACEGQTKRWTIQVVVARKRQSVRKVRWKPGLGWTRPFVHYLLLWNHVGVLAGNSIMSRHSEAQHMVSQLEDHEFLDVFRPVQDRKMHVFEMWMHKPTWSTDFASYRRLMCVNLRKPHLGQIAEFWRGESEWKAYDFVKVHLPAHVESFPGFMGTRYIAFPAKNNEKVPLMVHFNGVRRFMTGTVWLDKIEDGISSGQLFDVLDPGHSCEQRQLCSIDLGTLIFWPEWVKVESGGFLLAKQVDLDDSPFSNESHVSSCSTTWNVQSDLDLSDRSVSFEVMEHEASPTSNDHEEFDLSTIMQTQLAAGVFPDRVHENDWQLRERIEATRNGAEGQWWIERDLVGRTVRVFGENEISAELEGLVLHQQGLITLFLYGLSHQHIGMKTLDIQLQALGTLRTSWLK